MSRGYEDLKIHEEYNFSTTGDRVAMIQVKDTIFKVHRYLLVRHSGVFQHMLSSEEARSGPERDSEIIPLTGDTVEEFGALCWALYANPTEHAAQMEPDTFELKKITMMLKVANKYEFVALESWAGSVLLHHCNAHDLLRQCSYEDLCALIRATDLPAFSELRAAIEEGIPAPRLRGPNVPWDMILPVIEEYGSLGLRGRAYYYLLLATTKLESLNWESTSLEAQLPFSLSRGQKRSLRAGAWTLAKIWDSIPQLPAPQRGAMCPSHDACKDFWTGTLGLNDFKIDFDRSALPNVDVLRRLGSIERAFKALLKRQGQVTNFISPVSPSCLEEAIAAISSRLKAIENNLPEYFLLD